MKRHTWVCQRCKRNPARHGKKRPWRFLTEERFQHHRCRGDEILRNAQRFLAEANIVRYSLYCEATGTASRMGDTVCCVIRRVVKPEFVYRSGRKTRVRQEPLFEYVPYIGQITGAVFTSADFRFLVDGRDTYATIWPNTEHNVFTWAGAVAEAAGLNEQYRAQLLARCDVVKKMTKQPADPPADVVRCCYTCTLWHRRAYIHCQHSGPWGGNLPDDSQCTWRWNGKGTPVAADWARTINAQRLSLLAEETP